MLTSSTRPLPFVTNTPKPAWIAFAALSNPGVWLHRAPVPEEEPLEPLPGEEPAPDVEEPPPHPDPSLISSC